MANLLPQLEFLKKYRIDAEAFEKTTLAWVDLEAIHANYTSLLPELEGIATMISNQLMKVDKVHSVRYRTKDAEHLIAKIIRKRIDKADRVIDIDNYLIQVTDLIGLRAIHLFKEDWLSIHRAIIGKWDLKEDVKAYVREGDNSVIQNAFAEEGLTVENHKYGYRSIHYTAKTKPAKTEYFAEVQVRTIFEEGWSEIDHDVRYPYEQDNLLYENFSSILNRLAGSADEMGSFITQLRTWETARGVEMLEKQKEVERLQAIVDMSGIEQADKEDLKESLDKIGTHYVPIPLFANMLDHSSALDKVSLAATSALGGLTTHLRAATGALGPGRAYAAALAVNPALHTGVGAAIAADMKALSNIGSGVLSGIPNLQSSTPKPALKVSKPAAQKSAEPEPPQQAKTDDDEKSE